MRNGLDKTLEKKNTHFMFSNFKKIMPFVR